jgi:hypothetical protein
MLEEVMKGIVGYRRLYGLKWVNNIIAELEWYLWMRY